jgi:FSR family fosmidomycin resistance protein-like MFS transporter
VRDLVDVFRNRGLVTLMLGHLTVDSYVGVLPVLYPLLIHRFALNLETVGLVSLAYTGLASVSQPLFGVIADRFGTRFTGLALAWTAFSFALVGFAPSFPALVAIAAFSGLGSGAFHPLGALTVRGLLPKRGANMAMSVYVTGGTIGVAAGPLIGVVVFGLLGTRGTATLVVPGLAIGAFLLLAMRVPAGAGHVRGARPSLRAVPLVPLVATIVIMASRSWTTTTLQAYTPTWYAQLGYQPWFYGPLATTVVLASALGTVGTGSLADRFGRRALILATLFASVPAVLLFVAFPGVPGFLWAVLVGATAASTAPLMLMLAQELMAGRAGFASGLIMGLGFVTGAIGVPITGAVADHWGLQIALALQVAVVVVTIPVALLLPSERYLRRLAERPSDEAHLAVATGAGAPAID